MSLPAPNHTQTPNAFFDEILPQITSLAELKVTMAIIRQTFGWHKAEDKISLSQLEKLTGLSRESVIEGIKLSMKRGTVGRRKVGQGYVYGLRVESTSQESRPVLVKNSDHLLVKNSDPQKKVVKERKENTPVGASDDATGNATADEFVSFLAEELDTADVPYTTGWRGRHGKQFKECIAKGVESKTLYKACDRVVERWTGEEHRKLTVDQALEDVVNGKPPGNVTPLRRPSPTDLGSNSDEAAARRTEGYEFFFA